MKKLKKIKKIGKVDLDTIDPTTMKDKHKFLTEEKKAKTVAECTKVK